MKPVPVEFEPVEMAEFGDLARAIRDHKRASVSDGTWNNEDFETRNLKGIKGTAAVSRVLRVPFDRSLYRGPDPGYDLMYRGKHVEVKHLQKWLVFNDAAHFKCDIAVLVNPTASDHIVLVMGWIDKATFMERHFVKDLGYGPRLCLPVDQLKDMSVLIQLEVELEEYLRQFYADHPELTMAGEFFAGAPLKQKGVR